MIEEYLQGLLAHQVFLNFCFMGGKTQFYTQCEFNLLEMTS